MIDHRPDSPGTGPGDAELIRYLDGELDALGRARVERQIGADPASAHRLETLRRRGRRMAELLAAADAHVLRNGRTPSIASPAPTAAFARVERKQVEPRAAASAYGNRLLRAAVVVLALSAAAMLAPPVRALIADSLARLADVFDNGPSATGPAAGEAADVPIPAETAGGLVVHFEVATAVFRIDIDNHQSAGALVVRRGVEDVATAETDGSAELLVERERLRIRNRADDTASYTVILPASVREVHVSLGRQAPINMPLDGERRIELNGR